MSAAPDPASAASSGGACVLVGDGSSYEMFDVVECTESGARLVGPMLLEVGEEIRLRLTRGGAPVEVKARVAKVERGEHDAATVVTFVEA
jgi:hypothetical protein